MMKEAHILVVEDNRDNMVLIVDLLSTLDYTVIEATDGLIGVEKATQEKPDLILMDLSLPKLDGWAATRQIKANDAIKHIPIIALTAHAMIGDKERALEAGCDDYLTKPINFPELIRMLNKYLGNK